MPLVNKTNWLFFSKGSTLKLTGKAPGRPGYWGYTLRRSSCPRPRARIGLPSGAITEETHWEAPGLSPGLVFVRQPPPGFGTPGPLSL